MIELRVVIQVVPLFVELIPDEYPFDTRWILIHKCEMFTYISGISGYRGSVKTVRSLR